MLGDCLPRPHGPFSAPRAHSCDDGLMAKTSKKSKKEPGPSDDTEEVVRKRYEEYKAKTEPVLAHYEAKGVVRGVEGVGSLEEITERIKEAIGVA